jgi:DNA invertase Pin-like site-specific DNA recombinase
MTTAATTKRRLVGYVRVSSDGQLDGFGPDAQRKAIRSWARANGHRIVHWCEDAITGKVDALDRDGFACAVDEITNRRADGVVVARLDRLARQLTTQEAALAYLWKLEASLFTADAGEVLPDDPDDPMRTAIRQVFGVFAELDRKMVSKRLRDGRSAKAATGRKSVGDYAFGYRGVGRGRERDAGPNQAEQDAITRIRDLREEGASYREIAAVLDEEGYRPRRAESWSAMSVRNVAVREGISYDN